MPLRFSSRFILPWILFVAQASAQSVHWQPAGGTLPQGQATSLQLEFDDCSIKSAPQVPKVDGLSLDYAGQAMNMGNGTYSISLIYNALLTQNAPVTIPAFEVDTDKGKLTVPAVTFTAGTATVGSGGESLESAASSNITARPSSVWAGQILTLNYRIEASRSYEPDFGQGTFTWKSDPLIAEDWSQPTVFQLNPATGPELGVAYRTRAFIRKPGTFSVNPISQIVNLSIGVTGLGFFQQRQYQQFSIKSTAPTIEVRPLPAAPAGFSGAVGHFTLDSKVVPSSSQVGEPVTWTLVLKGTGNWPDINGLPAREVSQDFQVIQPKAKRTPAPGKIFDNTLSEDAVLVPTKAGSYTLEPVSFVYFDPDEGSYKTLTTPEATVTITAPPAPPAPPAAVGAEGGQGAGPVAANQAAAPVAPSGLPRDALPDDGQALTPWSGCNLALEAAAPFLVVIVLWLLLARRQAWKTDPQGPRREARARLAETLRKIGEGRWSDRSLGRLSRPPELQTDKRTWDPSSLHEAEASRPLHLLLAWQRDAAILCEVPRAAPSGADMPGDWASLWDESERALYGPAGGLPADWTARASAVLAATPAPAFAWSQAFKPRNLWPWMLAIVTAAAILGAPASLYAEGGPASAYARGDFPPAEAAWRSAAAGDPADWAIRYDLSLTLAQQNRWDEAAAQASAAFVQHPGNASVRWQFALACDKAGFVPSALAGFLTPGPLHRLAEQASPASWQLILLLAAIAAAVALAWLLVLGYSAMQSHGLEERDAAGRRVYGRPPSLRSIPIDRGSTVDAPSSRVSLFIGMRQHASFIAMVLLAVACVAGAVAWTCRSAYGVAADRDAVVTWRDGNLSSIPTEADTSQKTEPLPPGSVAVADKTYLDWTRLSFDNGETGWLRSEDAVPLWR